ncbi:pheromone A receptor-domain-containing protein [Endogone sp. FLAS-F59071]|nr:pheromone A receptor-domain-containing protein [Endogone sp. FLAS-F59071]|eukprot:RUS21535.1 pheromone A receptor-domain-containing protein [Endogone sp. FLAS-F59071]
MSIYNWPIIIFSSAGILGSVIPLPVHFRTTHHSAMVMTFWMVLVDLRYLINAIVWYDGRAVEDYMPQYCSVITTIQVAGNVALLSCSLCMIRDMWILVDRPELLTPGRRRRRGIAELLVCILWPLAFAALDLLVRPRIYDLGPVDGCFVVMSPTWESIGVVVVWQPLIACWGGYYASTYEPVTTRRQLDGVLMDHQLHRSTYFRIVGFCATYFLFAIPLSLWVLGSNIYNIATAPKDVVYASMHSDFWTPWRISDPVVDPMCYPAGVVGITWFMFFGTNQEAKRVYSWVWNRTGLAWACGNLKGSIGRHSDGISNNEGQLLFATFAGHETRNNSIHPSEFSIASSVLQHDAVDNEKLGTDTVIEMPLAAACPSVVVADPDTVTIRTHETIASFLPPIRQLRALSMSIFNSLFSF